MTRITQAASDAGPTLSRRLLMTTASVTFVTASTWGSQAATEQVPSRTMPADLLPRIGRRRAELLAAMEKYNVPGAAILLLYKGEVIWVEGFGITDRTIANPINTETLFSLQSISKNFTASAIMLAVQKGMLNLDTPITAYLPKFTVHSRFESAPERKITLRLLLSHRAGFTHEAPVGNNYYPESPSFEAHISSISNTWLRYPVGERYSYSNLGVDLAGFILQEVSGLPFAQCIKDMLFDPLGMTSSTISSDVYTASKNRAVGHEPGYDAVPLVTPLIPSGGVYTSAKDMGNYALFHLNKGKFAGTQILDQRLWEEMHTIQESGHYCMGITRQIVKYGTTTLDLFNHNGGGFGFGSVFSFYPADGLAWVALFSNAEASYEAFNDSLARELLKDEYGSPSPILSLKESEVANVSPETRERYIGNYIVRGDRIITFTAKDNAFGMQDGDNFYNVTFLSETEAFFVRGLNAHRLRFDAARKAESARVEWPDGSSDLDYNDGPNDVDGPNRQAWKKYLGDYWILTWGKPSKKINVQVKKGYLYVDTLKMLVEFQEGLFFAVNGEALDFRSKVPTFENIPLTRA